MSDFQMGLACLAAFFLCVLFVRWCYVKLCEKPGPLPATKKALVTAKEFMEGKEPETVLCYSLISEPQVLVVTGNRAVCPTEAMILDERVLDILPMIVADSEHLTSLLLSDESIQRCRFIHADGQTHLISVRVGDGLVRGERILEALLAEEFSRMAWVHKVEAA